MNSASAVAVAELDTMLRVLNYKRGSKAKLMK
jgi:hypothetical protein